jgi:hypothetical protein
MRPDFIKGGMMAGTRTLLAAALCALLPFYSHAQVESKVQVADKDQGVTACPTPMTGPALAQQMHLLSWKETEFVVLHEPGMKKVYDQIPENLRAQVRADPGGFPWDRFAGNRNQETLDRIAGLIHTARLQSTVTSFAPLNWPSLVKVLSLDPEFQVWVTNPKDTPLKYAAANPHAFEWINLLTTRNTCQLTTLLNASQEAAKAQPNNRK